MVYLNESGGDRIDSILSVIMTYKMMSMRVYFFFFNDTATTEIYTLSLHDALPIYRRRGSVQRPREEFGQVQAAAAGQLRSEEHTSELQSRQYLVCRLLLEKKKT